MHHAADVLGEATTRLLTGRRAEVERLSLEVEIEGSPLKWLQKKACSLSNGPPDLTLTEFLGETEAAYLESHRRLMLCARCPPEGGACAEGESCYRPGRQPRWEERQLATPVCDRWPEYAVRRRLIDSGVPPRQAGAKLREFERRTAALAAALKAAAQWAATAPMADAWLVLSGPRGAGKSHLAIGACRAVKQAAPRRQLAYALVPDLIRKLKESFDDRSLEPLSALMSAPIAVLDGLDPRGEPEWFRREMEAVIRERFAQRRSTLITTLRNVQEIANAYPSLGGLKDKAVTECVLSP